MKTPRYVWKRTLAAMVLVFGLSVANAWHVSGRILCDTNGNGEIDAGDTYVEGPVILVESLEGTGVFLLAAQIQPDGTFHVDLPDRPQDYVIYIRTNPTGAPILIPTAGAYWFTLTNEVQQFTGADFLLDCEGETPPPMNGGAVRSPGYWKNHPDAWPVEFVVIGGVPYAKADAIEMMEKPGGDRSLTLFFHLVATTLNLLVGAESECIADTVAAANAWFVSNPPGSGVHANSAAWKMAEPWKDLLDAYNTGELCAPKAD